MDTLPLCKHNLLIPISMPYLTVFYLKWPSFLYLSIHTMFFIIQLKILIHQCCLNSIFHQMITALLWINNALSIALLGFPSGSVIKNLPANEETWVWSLDQEDPLEKEMATHSSILAWEIPRTEESGGLQPLGLQKGQTQLSDEAMTSTYGTSFPRKKDIKIEPNFIFLQPHYEQNNCFLCLWSVSLGRL